MKYDGKGHLTPDQIEAFLDRRVDEEEREFIEEHIVECPRCESGVKKGIEGEDSSDDEDNEIEDFSDGDPDDEDVDE